MRSLLDASFLIALFDNDHHFSERATRWFLDNVENGWASCPLTENAVLRILTNPGYSYVKRFSLIELRVILSRNTRETDHQFWPDDISLLDDSIVSPKNILGPKQLTNIYLLALAVKNNGRLITFDEKITISAVCGATPENLCIA